MKSKRRTKKGRFDCVGFKPFEPFKSLKPLNNPAVILNDLPSMNSGPERAEGNGLNILNVS